MDLKEQMRAELVAARAIAVIAEDEKRDPTESETLAIGGHLRTFAGLKKQAEDAKNGPSMLQSIDAFAAELGLEKNEPGEKQAPERFDQPGGFKTIGQMFVESQQYKSMMAPFAGGRIQEKARVNSDPVGFKALVTGLSDTSGGAFVTTDRQSDVELLGRRPLTIRSLVSVRQTESDTVDFVQQTTAASSAAIVAEATSSAAPTVGAALDSPLVLNAGGGYKPEGSIAYAVVSTTVKTIAEWIPATKRSLADVAQLRGLIDQELRDDLAEEEEDQILNGSGSGENIRGILNTSGIQAQAYSATQAGLDPLMETALKGKTKVKTVGRSTATGYLLNPADWEKIQLARLAKNPANEAVAGAIPTLHGLPVVESEAIAAGVGLVGDFRKAVIWDRQQASITATDSHADFFIRNLVAILAEERLAFGVLRPAAFVTLDFTP
jgi:hypothetical protein